LDLSSKVQGPEGLVFTGEHDCFSIPDNCREVADVFEKGWFTTVDRANHLFHIQQFEVVLSLLLRFMQGTMSEPVVGCGPLVRVDDVEDRAGGTANVHIYQASGGLTSR
jgi:hypothetical protein